MSKPRNYIFTFRPSHPEWDRESELLDLDSLTQTVAVCLEPYCLGAYIMGWLDVGYHLLELKEVKEE